MRVPVTRQLDRSIWSIRNLKASKYARPSLERQRAREWEWACSQSTSHFERIHLDKPPASRTFKGEKPGDLPVINLKTAEALSLMLPQVLLALANELIE